MSSSRSTSRRLRQSGYLLCLLLLGGAGCRKQEAKKTPPPPRPVFVRLEPLVRAHPLQREVARLQQAENSLNRTRDPQNTTTLTIPYVLPALPSGNERSITFRALTERQATQTDRLTRIAEAGRNAFLDEDRIRRDQLSNQEATERRVNLIARDAATERTERERIYQEMIELLRFGQRGESYADMVERLRTNPDRGVSLTEEATRIRSNLALILGQLQNREIPLVVLNKNGVPVFDEEADRILQEEIMRLEAAQSPKQVSGVSQRSRLEQRQIVQDTRLQEIKQELDRIRTEAEARLLVLQKDAEVRREKEIAAALEQYGQNNVLREQLVQQETAIRDAIDWEKQNAARALNAGRGRQSGTGAFQIDPLFGGLSPATVQMQQTDRARQRLAVQRQHLETAIEQEVRNRIQDIALAQNQDLVVVVTSNKPAQPSLSGRTDETNHYLRLLNPTPQ